MNGIKRRNEKFNGASKCFTFPAFSYTFINRVIKVTKYPVGIFFLLLLLRIHRFINLRRNDIVTILRLLILECILFIHYVN